MRVEFLSSTPLNIAAGSGTFVGIDAAVRGLVRLGHHVSVRPLCRRTGFHTLDRWLYNVAVVQRPPDADVVVGVDLDGFLWARRRRRRFVVALKGVIADELTHERGWVRTLLSVQARWERTNVHRADRIVVPSRYSLGRAAALYGAPVDRMTVVPEAIDLAAWRALFAATPRRPPAEPVVLAVARMYPRKRLQDLLHAADRLRARIPDVRIRVVGGGPEAAALRTLHGRLGLGDTVRFLGEISRRELAVEYVHAQCFCLPTVQEGFGLVFAEAMAAGLPVVACRAAAVPEVVEDGRSGLLVSPRSPGELAAALERVLGDGALRKELGTAGARRVEAFDLEPVARRLAAALEG
jgi:glycosyltransferase involved in cell wall biosynthesis